MNKSEQLMDKKTSDAIVFSTVVTCFRAVTCLELNARRCYVPNDLTDDEWCLAFKHAALANSIDEYLDYAMDHKLTAAKLSVNGKMKVEQAHSVAFRLAQTFKSLFHKPE